MTKKKDRMNEAGGWQHSSQAALDSSRPEGPNPEYFREDRGPRLCFPPLGLPKDSHHNAQCSNRRWKSAEEARERT